MTKEQLQDFILQGKDTKSIMTVVEETGCSYSVVYHAAKDMGIELLSKTQEIVLFLQTWRGRFSKERTLKILDIGEARLGRIMCKELKMTANEYFTWFEQKKSIEEAKETAQEREQPNKLSVRDILSGFKLDGIHIDPETHYKNKGDKGEPQE